jgi:hypothetical protein
VIQGVLFESSKNFQDPTFPLIHDTYYSSPVVASFVESGFPIVGTIVLLCRFCLRAFFKGGESWKRESRFFVFFFFFFFFFFFLALHF